MKLACRLKCEYNARPLMSKWLLGLVLTAALAGTAYPQTPSTQPSTPPPQPADEHACPPAPQLICDPYEVPPAPAVEPYLEQQPNPLLERLLKYTRLAVKHRLQGLASYYSGFFDGRKTANGEIFRNARHSAAHLTLPLGTWVEITSRATGRKLRLRVNDRGPYVKKFTIDLSQAAARQLGVDRAKDRYVDVRIIALPGEEPLPEDVDWSLVETSAGKREAESTALAHR
jgi:rare lipoprotein A